MRDTPSRFTVSAHLFLNGPAHSPVGDSVLIEAVRPFIAAAIAAAHVDHWFFIRYTELGQHLRLRLQPATGVSIDSLRCSLLDHMRSMYGVVTASDGAPLLPSPAERNSAPHVRHIMWSPYEPEIERYGGPVAVQVAEDHFGDSSRLVLDFLDGMPTEDRTTRLGRSLVATLVLVHAFYSSRDEVARLFRGYAYAYRLLAMTQNGPYSALTAKYDDGYTRQSGALCCYIEDIWTRLSAGEILTDALDAFRVNVTGSRDRLLALADESQLAVDPSGIHTRDIALRRIVYSYLHMTNNRIGLSRDEETYVAHLLDRSLTAAAI